LGVVLFPGCGIRIRKQNKQEKALACFVTASKMPAQETGNTPGAVL
jgi:hypothetical protein